MNCMATKKYRFNGGYTASPKWVEHDIVSPVIPRDVRAHNVRWPTSEIWMHSIVTSHLLTGGRNIINNGFYIRADHAALAKYSQSAERSTASAYAGKFCRSC